ncbi:MAG: alanyl-tRNA editing protein [Pseudomonadota bacterium]
MQKLYNDNAYLKEFEAEILEVLPYKENYAVVLDKTAFYPEGGGQPSDTGFINDVPVHYVTEDNGRILHLVNAPVSGKTAVCRIDWDRRFDHMQQHSGQHILSSSFQKLLNGATDSFHLGKDTVSIEIGITSFDEATAARIEDWANDKVFSNLPIKAYIVNPDELAKLPLRKQPKVKENIRIIEIQDVDFSPCGGTHVARTGEVGLIKILGWEKLKESYRIHFISGNRALRDYRAKTSILSSLGSKLSARQEEIEEAFDRVANELKTQQRQSYLLNQELLGYETEELAKAKSEINGINVLSKVFEDKSFNDVKTIAQNIINAPSNVALFVNRGEALQVLFSRSDDVNVDMNALMKPLLPLINGKGGGSPKAAQGGGSKADAAEEFLHSALSKLKEQL